MCMDRQPGDHATAFALQLYNNKPWPDVTRLVLDFERRGWSFDERLAAANWLTFLRRLEANEIRIIGYTDDANWRPGDKLNG